MAKAPIDDKRRALGVRPIEIGTVTLTIEARRSGDGDGRHEYSGTLKIGGETWSLMDYGNTVTVKDPLKSRALMAALSPDGIRARVESIIDYRRGDIKRAEALPPEMHKKAAARIDTAELERLGREARKFAGLVRVAEVESAQARIGRVNRFAAMDDKGRDLKLENSDDAPVKADGDRAFSLKAGSDTYTAPFGAKGDSLTRGGRRIEQVWVVGAMIAKGFLEEVDADVRKGEPMWRETGDGHGVTLVATGAGLAAIGIEPEDVDTAPAGATDAPTEQSAPDAPTETETAPKARTPREGTKQAMLIAMLRAPDGATIEEIVTALGWRPNTARGAMAGALKKLGLTIISDKVDGRGRVYAIHD